VSLVAASVDPAVSVPEFGPSSPGRPPRFGRPALTLGMAPDCPPLDCDPAAVLDALASSREPDGMPAVELDEELEDALEDALAEREDGIGGCDDARDDEADGIDGDDEDCDDDGIEGDDGMLDELLDELGLLGDGIEAEDDELWLCD
jgi:hypothetical protein